MRRARPIAVVVAAAGLLTACSGGGTSSPASSSDRAPATSAPAEVEDTPSSADAPSIPDDPPDATRGTATNVDVAIADFTFAPDPVEVPAGATITWTNQDTTAHTASVAGDGPDTGAIRGGQAASLTFDTRGTYDYVCQFHPGTMTGTIVVS